jgi:hypothetical protein
VRDRLQVLDHLVLRTQRFCVHDDQLTPMPAAKMRDEIKAKAHVKLVIGGMLTNKMALLVKPVPEISPGCAWTHCITSGAGKVAIAAQEKQGVGPNVPQLLAQALQHG